MKASKQRKMIKSIITNKANKHNDKFDISNRQMKLNKQFLATNAFSNKFIGSYLR